MVNIKRYVKKIVSILVVLTIIINLIPNFGLLKTNATETDVTKAIIIKPEGNDFVSMTNGDKMLKLNIYINNVSTAIFSVHMSYPTSKLSPAQFTEIGDQKYIKETSKIKEAVKFYEFIDNPFSASEIDGNMICIHEMEKNSRVITADGELLVCSIYFKVNEAITSFDEISYKDFKIDLEESYINVNQEELSSEEIFSVEGFADSSLPRVASISVANNPTINKEYAVGNEVDLTDGTLKVEYTQGKTAEYISMSDANITTGDKEGAFADFENPITFEYEGKKTTLNVNIVDPIVKIEFEDKDDYLQSEIYNKQGYFANGEDIPTNNLYVKATTKTNATKYILLSDSHISLDSYVADSDRLAEPYTENPMTGEYAGKQKITVTYKDKYTVAEGLSTQFDIMVNAKIKSIAIEENPQSTYIANSAFNKAVGSIRIYGEVGENTVDFGTLPISAGGVKVTEMNAEGLPAGDVDLSKIGTRNLLISFGGKTVPYEITVKNAVKSIEVTPSEIEVKYNQELSTNDFSGIKIKEIMENGDIGKSNVTLQYAWIDTNWTEGYPAFNSQKAEPQVLKINYPCDDGRTVQGEITVQVQNVLKGITIEGLKTKYVYSEDLALDFTNANIYLNYLTTDVQLLLTDVIDEGAITVSELNKTKIGEQDITFTYKNEYNETATTTVKITISKAKPEYTVPTGLTATYGDALSSVTLPTGFAWKNPSDLVGAVGNQTHKVTFTPVDTEHYSIVEDIDVIVSVGKATPPYTVPTDLKAGYGDKLSSVTLPTGFTWENPDDLVGAIGNQTHKATYTPADTDNYNKVTGIDINVLVDKATPPYTVPTDLVATYGDTLSTVTLPSDANGTFTWEEAGTTLVGNAGERTHKATYTPTDSNFRTVNGIDVKITVKKKTPTYTVPTDLEGYEGQALKDLEELPTGFSWTDENEKLPSVATSGNTYNTTVTFTPQDTDNYEVVKNIDVQVTVKEDEIKGIIFTAPSKLTYNYGDKIDLTNGTITLQWLSGKAHTGDTIPMTKDMLSNADIADFDKINVIGTKDITVTYSGHTAANTFQIVINDIVDHIEIQDKSKLQTDYVFGDTINLKDKNQNASGTYDDLYILVKYACGTPDKTVKITSSMVSGFNMNKVQDGQVVTITYEGKTTTYTINVKDKVIGIEITKEPLKKVYKLNEVANFSDIVVKGKMKSGAEGITLSASEYTISGFNSAIVGEKTITVTENGTTYTDTFKIKVIDATTDMHITTLPKATYKYGEALDLTDGKITVKTQANTTGSEISMKNSDVKVTGYNPKKLGEQTLTVTYTYKELNEKGIEETKTMTDTFTVKVEDYWAGQIEMVAPDKKQYEYGEDLKLAGGKVGKIMASGAKEAKVAITGEMISGYDKTKVGKQTVTVTYFGKKATFEVTVTDKVIGISMNTLPNKVTYAKGEAIDVTGATINVTCASGVKVIPVTKEMISGYNANTIGTQVITVSYEGKTTQFMVNVKETTTPTEPSNPTEPTKPTEPSNPTNPTKPTEPTKPSTPTKPNTPSTPNDSTKPTTSENEKYTVKFVNFDGTIIKEEVVESGKAATAPELEERKGYKFIGWNKEFDVVEEDMVITALYKEIKRAEVIVDKEIVVEPGEDIDLSNISITIYDEDGNKTDEIPLTKDMISGFDSSKTGTQVVTAKYVGKDGFEYKASFKVKVKKAVKTLGEKDEVKEEDNTKETIIQATAGVGISGLLLLLIALVTRKNVEIYAVTEEGRKLIGKEKISKNNKTISLNAYKSKIANAKAIELEISDKAVEKFENETLEVIIDNQTQKYNIKKTIRIN